MKVPKVKLKHEKTGVILKVNESDWATDLGRHRYSGYRRIGEDNAGNPDDVIQTAIKSEGLEEKAAEVTTQVHHDVLYAGHVADEEPYDC